MNRTTIPVEEAFREWDKNPEFQAAYNALEQKFALALAQIERRPHAAEQLVEGAICDALANEWL